MVLYHLSVIVADLCKGSTNDSDSFCPGSNPGSAATKKLSFMDNFFYFYSNTHSPILSDGQPSITSATALECVIKIIFAHAHSPILSYKRPALYVPE